jgi:hypothetical protein
VSTSSGIDGMTSEWTPAFEGQRPPFEEGNELAVQHGAYAVLRLKPRAEEIAERLRLAMGEGFQPKYWPALEAAALAGARVEAAMGVLLEEADAEKVARLDQNARGWLRLYAAALERFGLMPEADALRVEVGHRHQVEVVGLQPAKLSDLVPVLRQMGQLRLLARYPSTLVERVVPLLTAEELEFVAGDVVDAEARELPELEGSPP